MDPVLGLLFAYRYRDSNTDLVGGIPTPLKNMKVSWDYFSQYFWKNNPVMFQTTNQRHIHNGYRHRYLEVNLFKPSSSSSLMATFWASCSSWRFRWQWEPWDNMENHRTGGFSLPCWMKLDVTLWQFNIAMENHHF